MEELKVVRLRKRLQKERLCYLTVIAILLTVFYRTNVTGRVCAIQVDGKPVALLRSFRQANKIVREFKAQIRKEAGQEVRFREDIRVLRRKLDGSELNEPAQALASLKKGVTPQVKAFVIKVDKRSLVATKDREVAKETLSLLKAQFAQNKNNLIREPQFKESVVIEEQYADLHQLKPDAATMVQLIRHGGNKMATYTVQPGDSAFVIAHRLKLTLPQLKKLNPGVDLAQLKVGDTINISRHQSLITVVTAEHVTAREKVPFERQTVTTSKMAKGEKKIKQKGAPGEKEVLYEVTLENGLETGRKTIKQKVLRSPIVEVTALGSGPVKH